MFLAIVSHNFEEISFFCKWNYLSTNDLWFFNHIGLFSAESHQNWFFSVIFTVNLNLFWAFWKRPLSQNLKKCLNLIFNYFKLRIQFYNKNWATFYNFHYVRSRISSFRLRNTRVSFQIRNNCLETFWLLTLKTSQQNHLELHQRKIQMNLPRIIKVDARFNFRSEDEGIIVRQYEHFKKREHRNIDIIKLLC